MKVKRLELHGLFVEDRNSADWCHPRLAQSQWNTSSIEAHHSPGFRVSSGLAGDAMCPPFLRARISRHQSHVCIVVFADILEVGKQESVFVVDREVANPTLGDFC